MDRFAVRLVTYGVTGSLALLTTAFAVFGLNLFPASSGPDLGFAFLAVSVVLLVPLLGGVVVGTTVLSRPFFVTGDRGAVRRTREVLIGLTYTVFILVATYFLLR
jgi:hypothetical protein